jgi:hypothetical protein
MSFIIEKELDIDIPEEEKLCELLGQDIEYVNYCYGAIELSIEFNATKGYPASWDDPGESDEITELNVTVKSVTDETGTEVALTEIQGKQLAKFIEETKSEQLETWCFEYLEDIDGCGYEPDFDIDY